MNTDFSIPFTDVSELTVVPLEEPAEAPDASTARVRDDGKIDCVDCGRAFTVKADGTVRAHKCVSGSDTDRPTVVGRSKPKPVSRAKGKKAPTNVRKFGVALVAVAVESSAATVLAKAVGTDSAEVPSALPEPDPMIGPFLDYAWPQLPAKAQKVIGGLADQEELINAAFLWYEWWSGLNKWAAEQKKTNSDKGAKNGEQIHGFTQGNVVGAVGSFEAFTTGD